VLLQVVLVTRHHHRNLGVVDDEVRHTSGERPPDGALAAAADHDEVHMLLGGEAADGRTRLAVDRLDLAVDL